MSIPRIKRSRITDFSIYLLELIEDQVTNWPFETLMIGSKGAALRILSSRTTLIVLLILNALQTIAMMWVTRDVVLSDTWSYLALANGILHGEYSQWWELGVDIPDTFRAPGYPLFLAAIIYLFGTWKATSMIQLGLYALAIWFTLKTIERMDPRMLTRNIFLILLLPMVNVPFYIMQIYTDIPALFGVCAIVLISMRERPWPLYLSIIQGLLFVFIFELKPVFLLLPLFFLVMEWFIHRRSFDVKSNAVVLTTFVIGVLPFGLWNLQNHGVFQVTPLQGGAGYMHFGYWCGKMPRYTDHIWLRNFTGDEVLDFVPESEIPDNIRTFEEQWGTVLAEINPLLTAVDTIMLDARGTLTNMPENTYSSEYTIRREKLLYERVFADMLSDPWYTLKYKTYSAIRLWIIGIQVGDFRTASVAGKLKMAYATIVTGIVFLLFILLVPLAYWRGWMVLKNTWPLVLVVLYGWLIHVPFTIQSRYTVCIRLTMLALLAMAIAHVIASRSKVDRS